MKNYSSGNIYYNKRMIVRTLTAIAIILLSHLPYFLSSKISNLTGPGKVEVPFWVYFFRLEGVGLFLTLTWLFIAYPIAAAISGFIVKDRILAFIIAFLASWPLIMVGYAAPFGIGEGVLPFSVTQILLGAIALVSAAIRTKPIWFKIGLASVCVILYGFLSLSLIILCSNILNRCYSIELFF